MYVVILNLNNQKAHTLYFYSRPCSLRDNIILGHMVNIHHPSQSCSPPFSSKSGIFHLLVSFFLDAYCTVFMQSINPCC